MAARDLIAPYTGWNRQSWVDLNDRLVLGVWACTGADGANPKLPGPVGAYGARIDSLEAFARSMQMATFRLAGDDADVIGAAAWYGRGLALGTDPSSPRRWPHPGESAQAKVEAASIALSLLVEPRRLWDPLPVNVKAQVVAWMEQFVGSRRFPRNNWVWFQLIVEAFLRQVGGRWSTADVARCLAIHESFVEVDGWYRDGVERSFDHYVGWALHTYPIIVAHVAPDLPGVAALVDRWRERLHRWLVDAVHLVGAHGGPLIQGRSLTYRFATAAPFWAGVLADATPLSPGLTRRVTSGMVKYFVDGGVPNSEELLSVGWFGGFPKIKQDYSGPGSPYWAGIGMLGLLLRADHPVWVSTEAPLPVEQADFDRLMPAPGWLVSGTVADGMVRVVNHGTDNAVPGARLADSAWYSRLAYSTHTAPDLVAASDHDPIESQVVLLDAAGRSSARTGFETLVLKPRIGVSRWRAHWVTPAPSAFDFGQGMSGAIRYGPWLTVGCVLRGAVEVRICRVDEASDTAARAILRRLRRQYVEPTSIRVTGAAVASADASSTLRSGVLNCQGLDRHGEHRREHANQLGRDSVTPWVASAAPLVLGQIYVATVIVSGAAAIAAPLVRIVGDAVDVVWPDGMTDRVRLPAPPPAAPGARRLLRSSRPD